MVEPLVIFDQQLESQLASLDFGQAHSYLSNLEHLAGVEGRVSEMVHLLEVEEQPKVVGEVLLEQVEQMMGVVERG